MAVWPYNTTRWKRIRKLKLTTDPVCETCARRPANQVDHITAIRAGGDPWDWDNLRSMCQSCHSAKTRHVDMLGRDRVPIKGADPTTGRPIDPEHPFNQKISQS